MLRMVLALSVVTMVGGGCGRTPLNENGLTPGDGGAPQDGYILPDGASPDRPGFDGPLPDGPRWDGSLPDGPRGDGPRADGPRPDGPRPDGPRPDGPRPDGPRPDAPPPFDGPRPDAPPPSDGSTPGVIECGTTTCNAATQECCVTWSGASCINKGAQCQGVTAECDGPEDCPVAGQICCGTTWGQNRGLNCTNPNSCNNGVRVCHLDADCATGSRCCGEETVLGITVQVCMATADCPNIYPTPGVRCGSATCYSPQVCCVGAGSSSCTAANACTQGLPVSCDGPEDCGGGTPVCCGQLSSGTSCVATGGCASGYTGGVVCHTTADCPNGQTCTDVPYAGLRVCF